MWDLIPEERQREIAANKSLAYQNLPEERKKDINEKIQRAHLTAPEDVKKERAMAVAERWMALDAEEKRAFARRMHEIVRRQWAKMPAAEKSERLSRFLASRSSTDRSESKRRWWSSCSDEQKESVMQALRTGYAQKMTPEKQRLAGQKRAATYQACPEKRAKARENALRNVEQCRANLDHSRTITDDEKRRRAIGVAATALKKFVRDVHEKYRLAIEGNPFTERERLSFKKRANGFSAAPLPDGLDEKIQFLTRPRGSSASSAAARPTAAPDDAEEVQERPPS